MSEERRSAQRMMLAHMSAAERNPRKRDQHLESAEYYRKQLALPAPHEAPQSPPQSALEPGQKSRN